MHPKAATKLELAKEAANDPKRTVDTNMRKLFVSVSRR